MKARQCRNQDLLKAVSAALTRGRATLPRLILAFGLLPRLASATAEPVAEEAAGLLTSGLLIGVGILALAALGVAAVTRWSNKQDHMNEMVSFCMGFLIDPDRVSEGQAAAAALGRSTDPRAILVLLDVVNDRQADQGLRKAAADALRAMGSDARKYQQIIAGLTSASELQDDSRLVELLIINFEKAGAEYVQSAYVIGRTQMRQRHYADAKAWLRIADARNKITPFYGSHIRQLMEECDQRLFAKGDELFKSGKYHPARERYSAASHGLSDEDSQPYSAFLRLACVYCKLGDYAAADEAVLLALKHDQETDSSLALNKLLQRVLDPDRGNSAAQRDSVVSEIDKLAAETIDKLSLRSTPVRATNPTPS